MVFFGAKGGDLLYYYSSVGICLAYSNSPPEHKCQKSYRFSLIHMWLMTCKELPVMRRYVVLHSLSCLNPFTFK